MIRSAIYQKAEMENLQLKLFRMRLMQTCTINAVVKLHFWTGLALLVSNTSVRAEEQKIPPPVVVEFQLISNGNHNGFASLVVSDFLNFQDNVATPTGSLSPYLLQVIDLSAREIKLLKRLDAGDQIYLLHEKSSNADFYGIKQKSGEILYSHITGTYLVFCQDKEPNIDSCYRIKSAKLKIDEKSSVSTTVQSNNTASIFIELVRSRKSEANLETRKLTIINTAKLIAPEAKERLIAEEKQREIEKSIIARAKYDHDISVWKEKQKEARERIEKVLKSTKSGTNTFCKSSKYILTSASDSLSDIFFTCDLIGSESIRIDTLLDAGWELISENRVAEQGFSDVGYIVHLRFRKN